MKISSRIINIGNKYNINNNSNMKRSRTSDTETFTRVNFDDVSVDSIRFLVNKKEMIDFYNITEKSFTNDSLSQFLKDHKRILSSKYKDNNFKFINCSKNKSELESSFKKIQTYFDESNLDINIWNTFISEKIYPYIDESQYIDIFKYIVPLNIIELYNLLKVIYSKNNLVIYANTLGCKKKKIREKNTAIELISSMDAWNNYVDFYINDSESMQKFKINKVIKIYNKQLMKKLFVYYKKDNREKYLRKYMNIWISKYRSTRLEYVRKIDVGLDPNDGLTSYMRLLNIDVNYN